MVSPVLQVSASSGLQHHPPRQIIVQPVGNAELIDECYRRAGLSPRGT
jgi:hypothetical protein